MSTLWRTEGLVKSGKTNTAVALAVAFFLAEGYKVFTNMRGCVWKGSGGLRVRWAESVTIDEIIEDVRRPIEGTYDHPCVYGEDGEIVRHCQCGEDHAWIRDGVFILDEAHNWIDPNKAGSDLAFHIISFMVQAGKRNILVIYTTHLSTMVSSKLRELTELTFSCDTPDKGRHIFLDVSDENEIIKARRKGYDPPDDIQWVFRGYLMFNWYDADEPIDSFSYHLSKYTSKAGKRTANMLLGKGQGMPAEMRQEMEQFKAEVQGSWYAAMGSAAANNAAPRKRNEAQDFLAAPV